MIKQAVILAAGRGTRLGELTQNRPKSMLPILGRPIMARVMDRLREAGIRDFVVVIGDQEGAIASYLSNSWHPDTTVKFAIQAVATGTVDALKLAAPYITGPFLLSSVDNLTSAAHVKNLVDAFNTTPGCFASLSLLPTTPEQIRKSSSVIIEGDRIAGIEEKPDTPRGQYASIMLYAFDTTILDYIPRVPVSRRGEREIASAIQMGIEDGRTVNYAITDHRLHLTRELDLLAINKAFLAEERDNHILSEIPGSVHLLPPVRIDPNVSIGQSVRLGPNVYIESGAAVGDRAVLENTLVLAGARVAPGTHCKDTVIDPLVTVTAPIEG